MVAYIGICETVSPKKLSEESNLADEHSKLAFGVLSNSIWMHSYVFVYTSLLFSVGIGSLKAPTAATSCAENSVYLPKIKILEEIESNYIIRVVATIVIIYQQCNIHFCRTKEVSS